MIKALSLTALVALAASAQAAEPVANYVAHHHIKGSSATRGTWDLDFIQLINRPARPLSAGDLKINAKLKSDARENICEPTDGSTPGNWSSTSQSTKTTFVSDRLLAVSIGYETSCEMSAHPDGGTASAIYDRELGQALDISTGKALDPNGGFTTELPAFNKLVLAEMAKQAQKEKAARGDHDCDDDYDQMSFTIDGVALSPRAISVDLSTGHADQACGFTTVIPLEKFAAVALKDSLLEQLAKAALKK